MAVKKNASSARIEMGQLDGFITGAVKVRSDTETEGFILYRSSSHGVAAVGSSRHVLEASVTVEKSPGVNPGIAIQNLGPRQQVELKLRDEAGNFVASAHVELPEKGHLARFITQFDWDSQLDFSDFWDSVTVVAPDLFTATAILLTPEGYATLPIAPVGGAR